MCPRLVLRLLLYALLLVAVESALADPSSLLRDFVADYRDDPQATSLPFVFEVEVKGEGVWTVRGGGRGDVQLVGGAAGQDGLRIIVESETLESIHSGRIGVLTAGGKARASDYAPFGFKMGGEPDLPEELLSNLLPFLTHFWTRGYPEVTPFGLEFSRVVHGAQAAALYYAPGLRTAWYGIVGDQRINAAREDQVNPFDTLIIVIGGKVQARLDGNIQTLAKGSSVFVPTGMTHEFWNEGDEIAEFIIVMFGEGA